MDTKGNPTDCICCRGDNPIPPPFEVCSIVGLDPPLVRITNERVVVLLVSIVVVSVPPSVDWPLSVVHQVNIDSSPIQYYIVPPLDPEGLLLIRPASRYDNGWPTPLNRSLLHIVPDALPPVVLNLQLEARLQSRRLAQSDRSVPSPGTSHSGKPLVVSMNSSDHAANPVSSSTSSLSTSRPCLFRMFMSVVVVVTGAQ